MHVLGVLLGRAMKTPLCLCGTTTTTFALLLPFMPKKSMDTDTLDACAAQPLTGTDAFL